MKKNTKPFHQKKKKKKTKPRFLVELNCNKTAHKSQCSKILIEEQTQFSFFNLKNRCL